MLNTIERKINEIKPYKGNAKKHSETQIKNVAESIRQFGFRQPIVLDKNNVIIIGHCRYEAAKLLNLETVPCNIAADLSSDQVKKLRNLDNKLNESEWDFDLLRNDISDLDFSDFDIDWEIPENEADEYEEKKREFRQRMEAGELSEHSEEYQEFLQKFEAKKTTGDCYTPENIYETVADYVVKYYGVQKKDFMRPFVPNGDYKKEKYTPASVVVDNPPFSIISEICKWYQKNNIKFFLFAPTLTIASIKSAHKVICGNTIVYENGANVNTSCVTNMDKFEIRSAPDLYAKIEEANNENLKQMVKELPAYEYPSEVVTSSTFARFSKYGVSFSVLPESCCRISELDEQKKVKKGIFGSGYLISDSMVAERKEAERREAEKKRNYTWKLSEREKEIVKSLK